MHHASLIQHYLALAQPYLQHYGYGAVFVAVMVEGFGIPAPGETLMIAAALLAAQGKMSLAVLPVAWLAAVIGDNIGYAIGHFGGRRLVLRVGRRFGVRSKHFEKVEHFFHRYGGPLVAVARFFDVLRQLNGVVAGMAGMRWWRFLAYNALGALLWVGAWGGGAYFLGRHLDAALALFHHLALYVIAVGVVGLILVAGYLVGRDKTSG
ncbi:MAG TPA: DedA family protein [Gammaproteobacteria bacterium]|nr:DedA family protein [Gammaproteobacteria bacterium]